VRKGGGEKGRDKQSALLLSLSLSGFKKKTSSSPLSSPLAHAPRPGCGDRLLAELLHGDDVDAAHGAFWFLIFDFDEVLRWLSLRREWF